jgi:hypothetical protein
MVAGVVGLKGCLLTPKGLELFNLVTNETQLEHLICKYILTQIKIQQ